MNQLNLFLPCAAGVEDFLADEVQRITNEPLAFKARGGVGVQASWRDAMRLNLHSRLTQRVLVQLWHGEYRSEQDLYRAAGEVAWEIWFSPQETIKVEITAQHSPLTSLNFAALKIKDAICDRFRDKRGERPSVNTTWPDVRIYAHLTTDELTLYIDTSGEPLFKRGWREDKGDAPLKETLAAAMIAATGWGAMRRQPLDEITAAVRPLLRQRHRGDRSRPDRAQHRARPVAPFCVREDAAFPATRLAGDQGRSRARAARLARGPCAHRVWQRCVVPHGRLCPAQRRAGGRGPCGGPARGRCPAAHAPQRSARCHVAQPALWRAHCRRRCGRAKRRGTRQRAGRARRAAGLAHLHRGSACTGRARAGPRECPDGRRQRWRRLLQPARRPLEEPLRGLERLVAHARPQVAGQDAFQGVASGAAVERPDRVPPVPL